MGRSPRGRTASPAATGPAHRREPSCHWTALRGPELRPSIRVACRNGRPRRPRQRTAGRRAAIRASPSVARTAGRTALSCPSRDGRKASHGPGGHPHALPDFAAARGDGGDGSPGPPGPRRRADPRHQRIADLPLGPGSTAGRTSAQDRSTALRHVHKRTLPHRTGPPRGARSRCAIPPSGMRALNPRNASDYSRCSSFRPARRRAPRTSSQGVPPPP